MLQLATSERSLAPTNWYFNLATSAVLNISSEAENALKVPTSQEIIGLNSRWKKNHNERGKVFHTFL